LPDDPGRTAGIARARADRCGASKDLSGQDVPGILRSPGAVRVKYESHLPGNERVLEVGYLAGDAGSVTPKRSTSREPRWHPRLFSKRWGMGDATKFSVTKKGLDVSITVATTHRWEGDNPGVEAKKPALKLWALNNRRAEPAAQPATS